MNSVFDVLFLRRVPFNYTSPAVCEAVFSSSAEPTIVLDPIGKYRGPTGPVRGGPASDPYLNWDVIPGLLCYNVYRSTDGGLTYELLLECIPPNGIYLCDPGAYQIYELFEESEQLVAAALVADEPITLVVTPQLFSLGFKVVKDATVLWASVQLPLVQICDFGCYEISGISPDGETPLSDPLCIECGPDDVVPCEAWQVWSWEDCACVICPEESCPVGYHWEAATCSCEQDTPPSPCVNFLDDLGPDVINVSPQRAGKSDTFTFIAAAGRVHYYYDRTDSGALDIHGGSGYFAGESVIAWTDSSEDKDKYCFNDSVVPVDMTGTPEGVTGVLDVNSLGIVLLRRWNSGLGAYECFLFDTNLGTLTPFADDPLATTSFLPVFINDAGEIAAISTIDYTDYYIRRYSGGVWSTVAGPVAAGCSITSMNELGHIVWFDYTSEKVNYNNKLTTYEIASVWDYFPTSMNESGVVTLQKDAGTNSRAYKWDPTNGLVAITPPIGYTAAIPYAVNNNGVIVGYTADTSAGENVNNVAWAHLIAENLTVELNSMIPLGSEFTHLHYVYWDALSDSDIVIGRGVADGQNRACALKMCFVT